MGKFSGALPTPSWKRAERKIAVGRCPHLDKILGLNEPISRRDFLDGTLVASAGMLLAGACPFPPSGQAASEISSGWTGYTGEGDYKAAAGNTEPVIQSAHAVRDGKYDKVPPEITETGEVYDCVVVGGGFAGLSAGLFFNQRATSNRTCLIVDNETCAIRSRSLIEKQSSRKAGEPATDYNAIVYFASLGYFRWNFVVLAVTHSMCALDHRLGIAGSGLVVALSGIAGPARTDFTGCLTTRRKWTSPSQ